MLMDEDQILDTEFYEREGMVRLPDDDDRGDEIGSMRSYGWLKHVLLSWNAWLAATLGAGLGVFVWRLSENYRGRPLRVQAGIGALLLAVDW